MIHRVRARINLDALKANFGIARAHAATGGVIAVVKANAYGHGLLRCAEALAPQADMFGVTDVQEAGELTAAGIDKPILVMQGIIGRSDIHVIAERNYHLVVHSLEQVAQIDEALTRHPPASPLTFWLKLNSGMGRLGLLPAQYANAFRDLKGKPYTADVVMMTHLANASTTRSPLNQQQLNTFAYVSEQVRQALPGQSFLTSIPGSSALLYSLPPFHSDWARPGIMLYGSSPFDYDNEALRRDRLGLRPVMTLESKIIAIQNLKAGDNVGYGSQYICPRDMRVGVVSIGYADGYPSHAPNGTPVLINGRRSTTVGRVSMDMIAVDLTDIPEARTGNTVTLWGSDLSIDEVANVTGVISYHLTCSVSPRVPRVYD